LSNVHFAADSGEAVSMLKAAVDPNIRFLGDPLSFIQLRIGKMNAFFLRNSTDAIRRLHAEFEAEGAPELWDPWTCQTEAGKTAPGQPAGIAGYRRDGAWVNVDLELRPLASALLVFDPDRTAPGSMAATAPLRIKRMDEIGKVGWKLSATGYLASQKTTTIQRDLPALIDWSLDDEFRGFSGRGVYTTAFQVSSADTGSRMILDLGDVRDVAEVTVNGKVAGTLLLRPYETDITELVQTGENRLEIVITNTLFNCMVMREPRTFRAGPTENPSGLMSAGLIGPVQLKVMS
jgi:hypothetical protein